MLTDEVGTLAVSPAQDLARAFRAVRSERDQHLEHGDLVEQELALDVGHCPPSTCLRSRSFSACKAPLRSMLSRSCFAIEASARSPRAASGSSAWISRSRYQRAFF